MQFGIIHQAPDRVRDIFAREGAAIGIRGQSPQMGMLRLAEAQRAILPAKFLARSR